MSENEQTHASEPTPLDVASTVESTPAQSPLEAAAARLQQALGGGNTPSVDAATTAASDTRESRPPREGRPPREPRKEGDRKPGDRGPRPEGRGGPGSGAPREGRPPREGGPREGARRDGPRRDDRSGGFRPDFLADIDLDKLISDALYLDNQAHAVVARMRDMDSATKSQLRRFYNAVRRACRAPEADRPLQFVMLRARLAYTISRHSLRSLDALERLLLQVTRKNDERGYARFRDLFEAIIAYNE